ncbi:MAG: hypothetical protein Q9217_002098 [Psora testacea]
MAPVSPESAPALPIPIFRISQKVERYMLYDIHVITWLRKTHNILGVLVGTLPQIPSQNVFLGLPLELLPEEARLLVEIGLACVVDDMDWHRKGLVSNTATQKEELRANLRKEGLEITKDIKKKKQARSQQAFKRGHDRSNASSERLAGSIHVPLCEEDPWEETLFETQKERPTTSPSPSKILDVQPWSITSATSAPFLPPPAVIPPLRLPEADPSSYALFKHLYNHGYFMTPGLRFGCQFSVYPGDPLRFHSHFLAFSAEWNEEIDLLHLIGGGRLGTGVKKGWMIGGVEEREVAKNSMTPDGDKENSPNATRVRTFCIEWGGM